MAIVSEYNWESNTWTPHTDNPARKAWRDAVDEVATTAEVALPQSRGRIESAVKIVLAGDVELLPDGTAKVASQSNGQVQYHLVNGNCECRDFPKAPQGFCKHRLAFGIHKRAVSLAKERLQALDAQPVESSEGVAAAPADDASSPPVCQDIEDKPAREALCPEALFSLNLKIKISGREGQLTVRGQSVEEFTRNVQAVRGLFDTQDGQEPAAAAEPAAPEKHYCTWHGELKPSSKKPGTFFCPGKLQDGTYCRSRWPA